MPKIVIQAGHCHRRTGVVGTRAANGFTEQQFTWPTANRARELLAADGHQAIVILADVASASYRGEVFVAIHADGNNNPKVGGASVGFRTDQGKALAHAWKAAYRGHGWDHGFRGDNYTTALSGYYGVKRAVAEGNRRACIIEAGFLTNPAEAAELASPAGQDRVARAIRSAINAVFGLPSNPTPQEDDMTPREFIKTQFGAWLGRPPREDTDELANHLAYLAFHGREGTIDNIAASPEAVGRRPA